MYFQRSICTLLLGGDILKYLNGEFVFHVTIKIHYFFIMCRITFSQEDVLLQSLTEQYSKRIEYILEGNLLEKSVKRPFCCTVFILEVYFTYLCYITFWALEYHFIENLKLMLKENEIMK